MGRLFLFAALCFASGQAEATTLCRAPDSPYSVELSGAEATVAENDKLVQALSCERKTEIGLVCGPYHQSSGGYLVRLDGAMATIFIRSLDGAFPVAKLDCR